MGAFFAKTLAITEMEVRKIRHDPLDLVTRAVQPVLWLTIFGGVFGRLRALPAGAGPYVDFLAPRRPGAVGNVYCDLPGHRRAAGRQYRHRAVRRLRLPEHRVLRWRC